MEVLELEFIGNGHLCTAKVELSGIGDSWNARATIQGHPFITQLDIKFWLGQFLYPVFSSREEARFFEPLLEAIDANAKRLLPKEFSEG
ncbi:hypothetical protein [Paraflavitalea speifideaquila]|uniref:hypothetical protein n=1 Tax=Paraflavitalea speifideaquila TaxID=3076558 RepID=UPI0028EC0E82|nr:hypothetical protein [Paraflavitalea speifideiaquila]